ncbi:NAD(P)-binding domain-containing protein [Bradyrhizobium sp. CB1650]|uniref:NAD(P)-binding domain-containing protein n=1 Tax=Bradyrhizobium sp. CB1650 TaxID=3039153 RepID=UPI0024352011|nr:NAD(P)-binding domain-containing protein [Bradyrhizobium sp. CB1650]WGD54106.1 NAD(P)-binding domain-containing protein [Bradyrhizobium sp. CB1650]
MSAVKTVAIIGAGPIGLAAAAHANERGMIPIVLEAGPDIGHAVRQWSRVRLFSPWEYNIDKAAARLLESTGWNSPDPESYPTGGELLEQYLEPLASRTALRDSINTSARVTGISRVGFDKVKTKGRGDAPFELRYRNGAGEKMLLADAVIDASGTWWSPNPAGSNGLRAIGESDVSERIAYGMPDLLGAQRGRYASKRVAVLGAGHSATGTLIDLVTLAQSAPGTEVFWLLRGDNPAKSFGGGVNDKLKARGALGSMLAELVQRGSLHVEPGFRVTHLTTTEEGLRIGAGSACCGRSLIVDELIVATGFRPDLEFLSELRLSLDPALDCSPALAPLIDPNEHSCGTVRPHGARELAQPEPRFYFAGMKSYGRAPTFLMLTGYEQVRSITAELAGDTEAARRVELVLPETGICNVTASLGDRGCCGGPAKADASACCASDEAAKQQGGSGCGCS